MELKLASRQDRASSLPRHLLVFLIVAFGAFLRFQAVHDTKVIAPLRHDAGQYAAYALNTLYHGTYSRQPYRPQAKPPPDALRPPVYPLFLAAMLSLSPKLPIVFIQYIQAIIGTATIVLSYLLFRRFLDPTPSCISTFLVAISPHLIMSSVYVLTEGLFTFGLLATLLFCVYAFERGGNLSALLSGAAFGALTLTRAGVEYFIVVVAALLGRQRKSRLFVSLSVLGFLVVLGAWSIRNVHSTGHMADNTLMIHFLHHGMYPHFEYEGRRDSYGYPYRVDPQSTTIDRSVSSVLHAISKRFREDPIRYLRWLFVGKPVTFWQWNMIQGMGDVYVYPVRNSPYFFRPLFHWTHELSRLLHVPLVCPRAPQTACRFLRQAGLFPSDLRVADPHRWGTVPTLFRSAPAVDLWHGNVFSVGVLRMGAPPHPARTMITSRRY